MYKVALLGNPNCGKTSTFNELTGSSQTVGNWPGVTVEKKEGSLKGHKKDIKIIDLPGIYSLSPYTLEEVIARDYIINEKPDVILNIVDASNIERNLYLTSQALDLDIPVIVALNMIDIVEKRGDKINIKKLEESLGVKVVTFSALNQKGIKELINTIYQECKNAKYYEPKYFKFKDIEEYVLEVENLILNNTLHKENVRWSAIKLLEKDEKVLEGISIPQNILSKINNISEKIEEKFDDDFESIVTMNRYDNIESLCNMVVKKSSNVKETLSDKIDKIVTNRVLGLPIFFGIMWFVYFISIQTLGDMTIGWIEDTTETLSEITATALSGIGVAPWLEGLIVDGIIAGVGAVLGFIPQIMILYLFIGFLEDCGYMSRVAFIMDRLFRKFGLSGKSFIPMLIGSGCSVPGIMASRTIENDKDRKMTIMLTPFIPCGAKLPVFALLIGAFFPKSAWVAPSIYILGIVMIIVSGIILKNTIFKGDPTPFVMELPEYRLPKSKGVLLKMWERAKGFIIKAGTVIFFASGLIWFLQSFDFSLQMVETNESILASIGRTIAPIFAPLGFGNWEATVATLTGFIAKEAVVSTFGILGGMGEVDPEVITSPLLAYIGGMFTPVSAYAFMAFTLLAAPCFAAVGAMRREYGNWKWTFIAMGYQTGLAWIVAFLIFQIGSGNIVNLTFGAIIIGLIIFTGIKYFKNSKNATCSLGCSGCSSNCNSKIS